MEVTSKKILYLITKANWGGAQRYVYDMATAMQKEGWQVVVAHGTSGILAERLQAQGIKTVSLPQLVRDVRLGSDLHSYKAIARLIRSERPSVLHLNSSKAGALGAVAGRMARVPRVIFTAHGWALNEKRPWWHKIPIAFIYYLTILLAHHTIAVSQGIRRHMLWMPFVSKKISVIYNGIAFTQLRSRDEARTLLPSHKEKMWLGIVAELHPIKRIEDAIDSLGLLAHKFPELILVVIGEGEMRAALEARIQTKGLRNKVFLVGFIENAGSFLSAFDIFLLPSRSEGLAYAILEAGAAELPVIASAVGGIPEILEEGVSGILVPPEHPATLARAISTLLEDRKLGKDLGGALKRSIEKKFSLDTMVKKTSALYRS